MANPPAGDRGHTERTERTDRPATAAARRRVREAAILAATRRLFDANGVRDAQIEDVARAVGVNRAIIYRHFSGKEELFALTLVSYLDELDAEFRTVVSQVSPPRARLRALVETFVDFGVAYPAFVDCALTLMRRPGPELLEEISEAALFRLGRGISRCLQHLRDVLEAGAAAGEFREQDTRLLANYMYATGLGALQLARVGMLVHESAPGVPSISAVDPGQVRDFLVATALALAAHPDVVADVDRDELGG